MSIGTVTVTGVVERMLGHAAHGPGPPEGLTLGYRAASRARAGARRSGGERGPEGIDDVLRPALLGLPLGDPVVHEGAHQRVHGEL